VCVCVLSLRAERAALIESAFVCSVVKGWARMHSAFADIES